MSRYAPPQCGSGEVTRIIRRALELSHEDTISYSELMDTARQIGLDPQNLSKLRKIYSKEKARRKRAGCLWVQNY